MVPAAAVPPTVRVRASTTTAATAVFVALAAAPGDATCGHRRNLDGPVVTEGDGMPDQSSQAPTRIRVIGDWSVGRLRV
jgi:hypothetical protein